MRVFKTASLGANGSLPVKVKAATLVLVLLLISGEAIPLDNWPRAFVRVEQVPVNLQTRAGTVITVLDARERGAYRTGHIPGAQHILWTRYRAGWFRSGRLPDDLEKLVRALAKLGVDDKRPVLVCGSAQDGWGEEGRIAWMIRYLGHPAVAILDGGCDAWREAGRSFTHEVTAPIAGTFTLRPQNSLRATTREVETALNDNSIQVLDVRTRDEFDGATPYFSSRGGHIPTAANIPFHSFIDDQGKVKERKALETLLESAGLARSRRLIVYCTGGVRSGFVTEILHDLGVAAANYDASFWEWSAEHTLPVK
jgi:thiosulfate/3-mercaptopyruvate sulfurtransferase